MNRALNCLVYRGISANTLPASELRPDEQAVTFSKSHFSRKWPVCNASLRDRPFPPNALRAYPAAFTALRVKDVKVFSDETLRILNVKRVKAAISGLR